MNKAELAQALYEGYCNHTGFKSLATGDDLPQYHMLPEKIQQAWEASAQAALDLAVGNGINIILKPQTNYSEFVEIEDDHGNSIAIGTRTPRDHNYEGIRITAMDILLTP